MITQNHTKPVVTALHQAIPNSGSGELGEAFVKSPTGAFSSVTQNQTNQNNIGMPSGGNYYSGIHTHPLDTYPMFSFSDLFVLNALDIRSASHNTETASFLVACIDDNGNPQTYAIVFDPDSLNETLDQFMNNPENIGCTEVEIGKKMDDLLGEKIGVTIIATGFEPLENKPINELPKWEKRIWRIATSSICRSQIYKIA